MARLKQAGLFSFIGSLFVPKRIEVEVRAEALPNGQVQVIPVFTIDGQEVPSGLVKPDTAQSVLGYNAVLDRHSLTVHKQTQGRPTRLTKKRAAEFLKQLDQSGVAIRSKDGNVKPRIETVKPEVNLNLRHDDSLIVRRTRNGVNKLIVFDEAHEYVDCKELVVELENAITQIRHDGLSFILASQFPEKIPESIFKYLLTRMIFKIASMKAINHIRRAAPNLQSLSPQQVSNLDLEHGVCLVQTDDDCNDTILKLPQLLRVRPRCTQHGGWTLRITTEAEDFFEDTELEADPFVAIEPAIQTEGRGGMRRQVEACPECGKPLVFCHGSDGPFLGCSGHPECEYFRTL